MQLSEYRRQGIKRLISAQVYDELRVSRDREKRNRHQFDDVINALDVRFKFMLLKLRCFLKCCCVTSFFHF